MLRERLNMDSIVQARVCSLRNKSQYIQAMVRMKETYGLYAKGSGASAPEDTRSKKMYNSMNKRDENE